MNYQNRSFAFLGLILTVGFCTLSWAAGPQTELSWSNKKVFVEYAAISSADFKPEILEKYFTSRLATEGQRFRTMKLSVTSHGTKESNTKGLIEVGYELWDGQYKSQGRQAPPVAELVVIHGSAIMRIRTPDGRIDQKILKGINPMMLVVGTTNFQILHLTIYRGIGDRANVYLYLQSNVPLKRKEVFEATSTLSKTVDHDELQVYFRNDSWFIRQGDFPIVYPFESPSVPPSISEYQASPEARCSERRGEIQCSATNVADWPN